MGSTVNPSSAPPPIRLTVNGGVYDVPVAPDTALLHVLRNDLELNGPKYGCGLGECGACTVLIEDRKSTRLTSRHLKPEHKEGAR
ncbi:hypothetical protein G6F65_019159 [Rhizopus arrhizus]|nr:hypothetical protein G6F65_019159 [Rhizopus arrhizus]